MHCLFNENLYFDDFVFNLYRKIWIKCRPHSQIHSVHSLSVCRTLNAQLNHLFELDSSNSTKSSLRSLFTGVEHLINSEKVNDTISKLCNNLNLDDESLFDLGVSLSDFHCCHSNPRDSICAIIKQTNFHDSYEFRSNLVRSLSKIHVEHQIKPLFSFAQFIDQIDNILSGSVQSKAQPESLSDLLAIRNSLGRLAFLFTQHPLKQLQFIHKLEAGIKLLASNIDSTQVEFCNEEDFSVEKLSGGLSLENGDFESNLKSILHSNWLDEFVRLVYFGTEQKLNSALANTNLDLFDAKVSQLKEMAQFLWDQNSRLSSLQQFCIDVRLRNYLNAEIDQIKEQVFNCDLEIYENYLKRKGFDADLRNIRDRIKINGKTF